MRHTAVIFFVISLFGMSCTLQDVATQKQGAKGFPTNYRQWNKLGGPFKRGDTFRTLYANKVAYKRTGKAFPVGTVLVKEVRTAISNQNGIQPGQIMRISVMRKVGKAAGTNGGWVFQAYNPVTKKQDFTVDTTGCYLCHMKKADNDLVFSNIPINSAAKIK